MPNDLEQEARDDWLVGQECFLPFWVLLDYVKAPRDPFTKCQIINLYQSKGMQGDGVDEPFESVTISVADLLIGPGLVANNIPVSYLIRQTELPQWAQKISDWFLSYKAPD